MEYLISNIHFDNSEEHNGVFYSSAFVKRENSRYVFEGYAIDEEFQNIDDPDLILSNTFRGCFNLLIHDFKSNEITIKNDKFGTWPLYIYLKGGRFAISNNLWRIIRLVGASGVSITNRGFKQYIGTWGNDVRGRTLFEEITEVPVATILKLALNNDLKLSSKQYWSLDGSEVEKVSLSDAVGLMDEDMTNTFRYFKRTNPEDMFCFGNSGGLDSRLVPIYASESNLNYFGITIEDKRPNGVFTSITHNNASKIAKIFNFKNHSISHLIGDHESRMILDVRNNPFGTAEMIKNPKELIPQTDFYLTGGNGFIVGGGWKKMIDLPDEKTFRERFVFYNNKQNAMGWGNTNFDRSKLFSDQDLKMLADLKDEFYQAHKHKDRLSIIRSFHQSIMNKRSPSGGFESINRSIKSYNIYYPIVFENTLKWKDEFFVSRSVLKELIRTKSPELYAIPDQGLLPLSSQPRSFKQKVERRIALKMRTSGLEYTKWVQNDPFRNYFNSVMDRDNDSFYSYFHMTKQEFSKMDILENLHPLVSLEIMKLKKSLTFYKREIILLLSMKTISFRW